MQKTEHLEPIRLTDDVNQTARTHHFDDIVHCMMLMQTLQVGSTPDWEYMAKRLIQEAKQIAVGREPGDVC